MTSLHTEMSPCFDKRTSIPKLKFVVSSPVVREKKKIASVYMIIERGAMVQIRK